MIIMPESVKVFSQQTGTDTELFIAFADLYNHYRAEVLGQKNLEFSKKLSLSQKEEKINKLLKNEIIKCSGVGTSAVVPSDMLVTSPQYKWATFAVINALIDMIIPDTIIDSVGLYTDIVTADFGNNFTFDVEPNDLFYVTKSGRGIRTAEAQKSYNGQVVVTPVEHDISVQVSLYRVLSGKENLAKFAMKALRSVETEMAYDAYTAFSGAMNALPTTVDKELQYTGWNTDNAIKLLQKVESYNNGAKPTFVGTLAAVNKILPSDSNYRYQLESDYVKLGYIKSFAGADVLVLPNKANWQQPYQTMLDDSKIYVVSPSSQKIVKLGIEGNTIAVTEDTYANANLNQTTTMKKMWATGVATNATFGQIVLD